MTPDVRRTIMNELRTARARLHTAGEREYPAAYLRVVAISTRLRAVA